MKTVTILSLLWFSTSNFFVETFLLLFMCNCYLIIFVMSSVFVFF